MEIKSYNQGWNDMVDRAIELIREIVLEDCDEVVNKLIKKMRE